MKSYLLFALLLIVWTGSALAFDPHPNWTAALHHLQAAKTAGNSLSELDQAKKSLHAMSKRWDHKQEQLMRSEQDIDAAIDLAKKGANNEAEGKQLLVAKINSAIAHLQQAK